MKRTFKEDLIEIKKKYLENFGIEIFIRDGLKLTPEEYTELDQLFSNHKIISIFIGENLSEKEQEETIKELNNDYLCFCEAYAALTPFRDRLVYFTHFQCVGDVRDDFRYAYNCFASYGSDIERTYALPEGYRALSKSIPPEPQTDLYQSKYIGGFFGQLAGDAFFDLKFPTEVSPKKEYLNERYDLTQNEFQSWKDVKQKHIPMDIDYVGSFWNEGFSILFCLMESLKINRGFNAEDQLSHYLRYVKFGHCGPNFISYHEDDSIYYENIVVSNSLNKITDGYEKTLKVCYGVEEEDTESLMRILPITLFYLKNPVDAIEYAGLSSQVTHKSIVCRDACRYLSALLIGATQNIPKEELLSYSWAPIKDYWDEFPLCKSISKIAQGEYKNLTLGQVKSDGFILDSLNLALSAFFHTNNFEDGFKWVIENSSKQSKATNVYGCLAGTFYGFEKIIKYFNNVHGKYELRQRILDFYNYAHENLTEEQILAEMLENRETLIYNENKNPKKPPYTFGIGGNYPHDLKNFILKKGIPKTKPDPLLEKFKKMSVNDLFEEKKSFFDKFRGKS